MRQKLGEIKMPSSPAELTSLQRDFHNWGATTQKILYWVLAKHTFLLNYYSLNYY